MSSNIIHYDGGLTYLPHPDGERDEEQRLYLPYIPDKELIEAVNLAIDLHRPLLLEGEPGCGKTRLAGAVAYELTKKVRERGKEGIEENFWYPYYTWNIKSTSKVRDGLYRYDAVNRLRDTQIVGADPTRLEAFLDTSETEKFEKLRSELKQVIKRLMDWENSYFQFGSLGKALQPENDYRPILLVDEIDKADNDFPNDLLLELDEFRFDIPERGKSLPPPSQDREPIIFITSNRGKPLPDAFLRRCIYYYLEFPSEDRLREIIRQRFTSLDKSYDEVITLAIERFYKVRGVLELQPGGRPPGTSEFLDFLTVIIKKAQGTSLDEAMGFLENLSEHKPELGLLLKSKADQDLYRESLD